MKDVYDENGKENGKLLRKDDNGDIVSEPVDRARISDASITELENAVNDINDKPTQNAVLKIVEILIGEELNV